MFGGDPGGVAQGAGDIGLASLPGPDDGRFQDTGLHPGGNEASSLGGHSNIPPLDQPGPRNVTEVGNFIAQNPVKLADAGMPDDARYSAKGAGSAVTTAPTVEDAARSAPFGMKDAELTTAWRQAVGPLYVEQGIRHAIPSLLAGRLPQPLKSVVTLPAKYVNHVLDESEPQRRDDAYQAELYRRMNDTMAQSATRQSIPPAVRGFFAK